MPVLIHDSLCHLAAMILLQAMSSDSSSTSVRSEFVLSIRLIPPQPRSSSASFRPEPVRYMSTQVPIILSHFCISSTTLFSCSPPISSTGKSGCMSTNSDVDGTVATPSLTACNRQRLTSSHLLDQKLTNLQCRGYGDTSWRTSYTGGFGSEGQSRRAQTWRCRNLGLRTRLETTETDSESAKPSCRAIAGHIARCMNRSTRMQYWVDMLESETAQGRRHH